MTDFTQHVQQSKDYFNTHETKSLKFRKKQLKCLAKSIKQHEKALLSALAIDLGKNNVEAYATEIGYTLSSIKLAQKSLHKWAKTRSVDTPLWLFPTKSFIMKEPLGTVLIIGPYNYPFQLVFEPLIGALAAGNTAVIKPSELTPHVADVIENIITSTFDPQYVSVVQGDASVIQALLKEPFDHIFFTGSQKVGKIVYKAAAEHLTPVTLELGGKSPVIVDQTANLKVASERICFGKFLNAGQTCVAPDYVLIDKKVKADFIAALRNTLIEFYSATPLSSEDLGVIVNDSHFDRLAQLMDAERKHCVIGGERNTEQRKIAPSIYDAITLDSPLMQDELFGPLLPIMTYETLDDAISTIHSYDKPLALYLFSEDENVTNRILTELSFGGGAINDTVLHLANPRLPFGGIGGSGIGQYHGKYSFNLFSHDKSYIFKTTKLETGLLFPPYKGKLNYLKQILKKG
ncbi:aldehyde dehydrogenase [Staphylococcus sp. 17KM0847]|uniref:aldehyde dehydrogenase n=1 Tax=Staphylococcus sp. 17KM0847 TaxID=2583989 RepID=UPI0015DD3671|nr:aldehyde dehydrogenase [Staphylococcus sp. 17KM0847]QLK86430.1 aldehyde dehydrogenase [Staphylococcus sp. 17KM0847]